jgi:tRNA(fMet)-specific endonuclease VapC
VRPEAANYLLDTNACIALINGKPAAVRTRFEKAIDEGAEVLVPSVVTFELWYGVARSTIPETNARRVREFLGGPIRVLAFEDEDARRAGEVRAELERIGRPIGAYDVLIAGQALQHGYTLVTANAREFARVAGLQWEDWGKG